MRFQHTYTPPGYCRFANVFRATGSTGTNKALVHVSNGGRYISAADAADGDIYYMDFYCDGTETRFQISTRKSTDRGTFDLYVNGVLDSSGYDEYAAAAADAHRDIVLTIPVRAGYNLLSLRVNGKNVAASDYVVAVIGASLC